MIKSFKKGETNSIRKPAYISTDVFTMEVFREFMTLVFLLRKCIRCCDRLGDQEEVPQNNAMLEKHARVTKYSPRNCKGHNEIHKLIAAACKIKNVQIL